MGWLGGAGLLGVGGGVGGCGGKGVDVGVMGGVRMVWDVLGGGRGLGKVGDVVGGGGGCAG